MERESPRRTGLLVTVAVIPILVAAALWLPRWWENKQFWEAQEIAGVGSEIVPGNLTDARKKIDPGMPADKITGSIGKPSMSVGTEGKESRREIWTYYFTDGTMTVNLTDGVAVRVSTVYGRPKIPRSKRAR